jgi:ABC-type molybdate transport system substrate-binding protein
VRHKVVHKLGRTLVLVLLGIAPPGVALAEPVVVLSAGSLRGVVGELTALAKAELDVEVVATFGGSGLLRERIEKGEKADLFLSADLGSPQKLAAQGRTVVPPIAFARNRMCIVSRQAAAVTPENFIDRMLAKGLRLKTSTPIADPSGDYAWSIFERIDAVRPGAGAALKEKAQALMAVTASSAPGQSPGAALFATNKVDISITYCSGYAALAKDVPGLTSFEVPARYDPHPVYGAAVLANRPEVLRLTLLLLSEKGQAIVSSNGLVRLVGESNSQ